MSPIPNQNQLIDYLQGSMQQPVSKEDELELPQDVSQFQINILTSSNAKEQTNANIMELEKITGQKFKYLKYEL